MRNRLLSLAVLLAGAMLPLSAAPVTFFANLSGPAEEPPNTSPATGLTLVTIDPAAHTLQIHANFSGLLGLTTVSHIHVINGPGDANTLDTAGPVATTTPSFPGFPAGVTAGTFDGMFNTLATGTYRAGFLNDSAALHPALTNVEAAELELFEAIVEGRAYLNIHTGPNPATGAAGFPGGEIRGFLAPVPEPSTFGLGAVALAGLVLLRRRRAAC